MDFNRLFHEKIFYLSILLALASILIGTAWSSIPPGTVLPSDISFSLLESALQSKAVLFALPVARAGFSSPRFPVRLPGFLQPASPCSSFF